MNTSIYIFEKEKVDIQCSNLHLTIYITIYIYEKEKVDIQ